MIWDMSKEYTLPGPPFKDLAPEASPGEVPEGGRVTVADAEGLGQDVALAS